MTSAAQSWTGDEWQEHAQRLLKRHYGTNYQEVPDHHQGDLGIEGFSLDGVAYQCYAAEDWIEVSQLYQKQRDKMSADIRKFIRNRAELEELFGSVMIRAWILMVPQHDSRFLISHASKKTEEVVRADLPYVEEGFRVMVITDDHFEVERAALVAVGLERLAIERQPIEEVHLEQWGESNVDLLSTLDTKAGHLSTMQSESNKQKFVNEIVKAYLEGQSLMSTLHDDYPQLYNEVIGQKTAQERLLTVKSQVSSREAGEFLTAQLTEFQQRLGGALPGVGLDEINSLVGEAVADWLMRCPLDFPDRDRLEVK